MRVYSSINIGIPVRYVVANPIRALLVRKMSEKHLPTREHRKQKDKATAKRRERKTRKTQYLKEFVGRAQKGAGNPEI